MRFSEFMCLTEDAQSQVQQLNNQINNLTNQKTALLQRKVQQDKASQQLQDQIS